MALFLTNKKQGKRSHHVFILGLIVSRAHWRRGIGRAVMDHLISASADLGAKKIFLDFNANNVGAQRMYEGLGFVYEGRKKDHLIIDGEFVDLVQMAKFI